MATSGSFQSNNEKYCNLYVEWKVTGQSVANNTSTVQVDVYLKHHALNIPSKTLTINFGSTVKTITTPAINIGSSANTTKLGSATLTAWHNANGTKSLTIGVTMPIDAVCDGTQWGSITASGSATFNTIARPTTPTLSATTVELGQSVTINMARNLSSLTHTLTYSIGANSGTIGSSLATSKAWTPAIDLAHQIPKSTSGVVTITCKTYSGSTLIGTKTVTLTVTVPASVVPTIESVTFSDPTGYGTKYGNVVQNYSKYTIAVEGKGAYSSTISGIKVEANGSTMTLSSNGSVTTGALTTSGINTIIVTVTDSRGRTASATYSRVVLAYTKPKATISAYRCDSNGNESPDGAYIKATISGSVTALNNKNSKTFKIQYKKATDANYTDVLTYNSAYTYSSFKVFAADVDSVYNVRAVATDDFNTSTTVVDVSTSYTIIDFKADGKGIAFGKASTEAGFDVEMATKFRQDVRSAKDVIAGLGESYQCGLIETHKATQGIIVDNLIPFPYNEMSKIQSDVTWNIDENGIVEGTGTASADSGIYISKNFTLKAGTYTLSGCPVGGSANTYRIQMATTDYSWNINDFGNGVTFTLTEDTTFNVFRVLIRTGVNASGLIFKPMLEPGEAKHSWQSCKLSRQYITDRIDSLQPHPYSLIINANLTTTETIYDTYGGRLFSDYGMLEIQVGVEKTDVRASILIPRKSFDGTDGTTRSYYLDFHSNYGNTFNQVCVKFLSNTQIKAYIVNSNAVVKYLNIHGIKVDDVTI